MKLSPYMRVVLTIAVVGIAGCSAPKPQPTPTPTAIEAKLELDNLSFQQADNQGKPLWKVRAAKGVYTPDRKRAKVTNLEGDLYQDGKIILHVTAKSGEVEQEGEKIFLRGDVVTKEVRNDLLIVAQEVEWRPKADLLAIRDRVQATQANKFQANASEGKYISRKQQMDLSGKINAFASEPQLAMQTERLTWLVASQTVTGDRPIQLQRYQNKQITARIGANSSSTALDRQIVSLRGKVNLDSLKPPMKVDGESFSWNFKTELVSADRPLTIFYQPEALTFTANAGELDLQKSIANLTGNASGTATRNQTKLRADRLTWDITSQQLVGTGNVVYQQVDPIIKFSGVRGVGKLQDRSIVVSGNANRQVRTDFVPEQRVEGRE